MRGDRILLQAFRALAQRSNGSQQCTKTSDGAIEAAAEELVDVSETLTTQF